MKEILQLKTKPKFEYKKSISHCELSPYSCPDYKVKNYSPQLRADIGQGILDLLNYIKN